MTVRNYVGHWARFLLLLQMGNFHDRTRLTPIPNICLGNLQQAPGSTVENCTIQGTLIVKEGAVVRNCVIPGRTTVIVGENAKVESCEFAFFRKESKVEDGSTVEIGKGSVVLATKLNDDALIGENCFLMQSVLTLGLEREPFSCCKIGDNSIIIWSHITLSHYYTSEDKDRVYELGKGLLCVQTDLDVCPMVIGRDMTLIPYQMLMKLMLHELPILQVPDMRIEVKLHRCCGNARASHIGDDFTATGSITMQTYGGNMNIGNGFQFFGDHSVKYGDRFRFCLEVNDSIEIRNNVKLVAPVDNGTANVKFKSLLIENDADVRIGSALHALGDLDLIRNISIHIPRNSITIL